MAVVTSTRSMALRATAAWRPHPVWHVPISVCSAGGECLMTFNMVPHDVLWLPRHHTNPVGTEWRWKTDDPHSILQGALENHYQMVKQFKGQ